MSLSGTLSMKQVFTGENLEPMKFNYFVGI